MLHMMLTDVLQSIKNVDYGNAHSALPELQRYVESGGDLNVIDPESGWGILHSAAEHQDRQVIEAMAEYGADLNIRSKDGCPAVFQALDIDIDGALQTGKSMTFETTILFLKLGAESCLEDQNGQSLSEFATTYGPDALARFQSLVGPFLKESSSGV